MIEGDTADNDVFSAPWDTIQQAADGSSGRRDDMKALLDDLWRKYDIDSNGKLDIAELTSLCRDYMLSIPEIQSLKAKMEIRVWACALTDLAKMTATKIMTQVDHNNDGFVDPDEFHANFWMIIGHGNETSSDNDHLASRRRRATILDSNLTSHLLVARQASRTRMKNDKRKAAVNTFAEVLSQSSYQMTKFVDPEQDKELCVIEALLQIPPELRTPENTREISATIGPILHSYKLSEKALNRISSRVLATMYRDGEKIVSGGEKSLWFYIVLSGSVLMYTRERDDRQSSSISIRGTGECFGEIGLLNNSTHPNNVIGRDPINIIAKIDQETYNQYMRKTHLIEQRRKLHLFSRCPIIQSASHEFIQQLSLVASFRKLERDEIIFQQGDEAPNHIYFVESGEIRILVEFPPRMCFQYIDMERERLESLGPDERDDPDNLALLPTGSLDLLDTEVLGYPLRFFDENGNTLHRRALQNVIAGLDKDATKPIFVQAGILGPFSIFGDECLQWSMDSESHPLCQISVISNAASSVLVIPKKDMLRRMAPSVVTELAELCKHNPTRRQILHHLEHVERWKTYTRMVIDERLTKPYSFRDFNADTFWKRCQECPEWSDEGPDKDAGANRLFRPRYYQHRLRPLHQVVSDAQPAGTLGDRVHMGKQIGTMLSRIDPFQAIPQTPRGYKGLFEGESNEKLRQRNAEFSVEGMEQLLFDQSDAIDRELQAIEIKTRERPIGNEDAAEPKPLPIQHKFHKEGRKPPGGGSRDRSLRSCLRRGSLMRQRTNSVLASRKRGSGHQRANTTGRLKRAVSHVCPERLPPVLESMISSPTLRPPPETPPFPSTRPVLRRCSTSIPRSSSAISLSNGWKRLGWREESIGAPPARIVLTASNSFRARSK